MKRCICCHEQKRLTEFYPHPQMRDGHLNKCKGCVIAYGRERRKDPVVAQKLAAYERARMQTPKRKAQRKAFFQRYALRHPDKYDARDIVNNALRDGRLAAGGGEPVAGT